MSVLSGVSDFFGLDIGTSAIRLVQLRGSGPVKALVKYALTPIDTKLVLSDAKADQQKVASIIKELVAQARVNTKNVTVGLPSQRVFTTVVDIERLSPSELAKNIKFQADTLIPTPLDESKIDWALLGDSPVDANKVEVLISSVANTYVEQRLDTLEAIGLNVIAFEPDTIALARAMTSSDDTAPQVVVDIGTNYSDLVIVAGGTPKLNRSIPTGSDAIIKAAMQGLGIDDKQAEQFVYKFGLSKDKLEGQIYAAIIGTVETLVSEIEKSIKFYQTRYPNAPITKIVVTGGASTLPEFPLFIANKFGINVEIGNAWRNVTFPADKQNELLSVSNHFGVAAGLAERIE
ncbi:MAG TPA: type IV pilus assembly protein PilM [Candidatus Saccharibacteria bacterium]|nr:type IV pilus assembly protein PilM [Candidatus Saccharibacteria bacterium]MCB9817420.1 type IV pilus assembly protein PilM [Candidatus Nomurabacteria bacterium]HPD99265.1 type IV pilus assembly protein PilM [Candidatus Saccharibacteria bacterium]HPR10017.1 type IV pilus assembly protein PilM [Candidatus Saccharibacteria bacterium]